MKYEILPNLTLPKIGFGAWSIGGGSYPDPKLDPASMTALRSALEVGYTHFDTAEAYASGHSEELIGRAVRETNTQREDVFITTKVSPEHLAHNDVLKACENSLRRLNMDYIDLYLIHWPPRATSRIEEAFRALNGLVRAGKVRHLGVSNFNLKLLKKSQELSETPIITNQVPYRLPDRSYVENGVLEYCQQNDILITAYSPVKFRSIRVNNILGEIAKAHSATPFQIALAWLVMQPRVITIPMSYDPQHIRENFEAADIELSEEEMSELSNAWK
ncbi:MAG: aldo/keto reductase [Anaerolineales bacterium]|nr:aldo/keto reductase [Anaerolineae bacterium]PWB76515.1 MAG: aldo/keto reductase [Anaerolineales bacterium]